MDSETLKALEAKYWEGRTSSDEDRALMADALRADSVLSDELKQLMGAISVAKTVELGSDFDDAFWEKVDGKSNNRPILLRLAAPFRYAAAIIIAVGLGALLWLSLGDQNNMGGTETQQQISAADTYEDPEKAFEETKKALMLVSQKFNKGAKPLGEIKRFHSVQMSIAAGTIDKDLEKK